MHKHGFGAQCDANGDEKFLLASEVTSTLVDGTGNEAWSRFGSVGAYY